MLIQNGLYVDRVTWSVSGSVSRFEKVFYLRIIFCICSVSGDLMSLALAGSMEFGSLVLMNLPKRTTIWDMNNVSRRNTQAGQEWSCCQNRFPFNGTFSSVSLMAWALEPAQNHVGTYHKASIWFGTLSQAGMLPIVTAWSWAKA